MNQSTSMPVYTALITGGSSGLGEAMAKNLAAKGHRLVLVSENSTALARVKKDCHEAGAASVDALTFDLFKPDAADQLYSTCVTKDIAVDILINCAGIFLNIEKEMRDMQCIENIINLHIVSLTKLCFLFGRGMIARRNGYIMNISSIAAGITDPASLTYGPTKRYIRSFSEAIHCDWREHNVRVTCLTPGGIKTNLFASNDVFIPPIIRRTLITADVCAAKGLSAMFRGKARVTPGLFGKLQLLFLLIISHPLTYGMIKRSYFSMKEKDRKRAVT
jgi:short-subunit dehydrogenase